MRLFCFAVPLTRGTLYGIRMAETKEAALDRLRSDDPCWSKSEVYQIANLMGDDLVFIYTLNPPAEIRASSDGEPNA